ncbi:hypothetical protein IFM89_014274 [Coptis chinensis]|uniref:F-box domain-containing protein n=1 Tax=Coptis chinensis TaxID=261450 RepID=A0A835H8A0_9MAGN|nr:hypothetical protein IFM89_014274 [Coptis chinensis]
MISVTILIPFPLSFSFCTTINLLLLSPIILLLLSYWFAKLFVHKKHRPATITTSVSIPSNNYYDTIYFCSSPPSTKGCTNLVLPDDTWVEVMCRLPPKHMVRFKLVSKSWNMLISDVCIPKITSPITGLLVPTGFGGPDSAWHLACINQAERMNSSSFMESCFRLLPCIPCPDHFLDSSNGFLLFVDPLSGIFYVCNPSTEQCIAVPRSLENHNPVSANLIIDHPHFKIVYLLRGPFRMNIYSSETRRWTRHIRLELPLVDDSVLEARWTSRLIFLDGFLYDISLSGHLLKVVIKRLSASAIKLPKIVQGKSALGCIGVSKGSLHYAWNDPETYQTMVWMLDKSDWVLKHTLSLRDFAEYQVPCILDDSSLLAVCAFHPTSDVVYLAHKVGIFCYHFGREKLEFVYKVRSGTTISSTQVLIVPFSRNLATLDALNGINKKPRRKKQLCFLPPRVGSDIPTMDDPPPASDVEVVLPDDAWAEVLCRLPPKHMVRFKSVSKSWYKLITDVCIPKITSPILGLFVPTDMGFSGEIGPDSAWHFACVNQMYIYSSTTRRWIQHRRLELEDNSVLKAHWTSHVVFLDGSIHVISVSGHLVVVDIDKVTTRTIKLPKIVEGKSAHGCMGVSKEVVLRKWEFCYHFSNKKKIRNGTTISNAQALILPFLRNLATLDLSTWISKKLRMKQRVRI